MGKRLAGHLLLPPTLHIMEDVYSKMSLNLQYQITVMPHYTSVSRTGEWKDNSGAWQGHKEVDL